MVKIISSTEELMKYRQEETTKIGFVPTMGNLHAGHISLLEAALKDFSVVYFSIFVNPKQFGPNEDFEKYPRTLEQDIQLIEELMGRHPQSKVVIYAPKNPREVFPSETSHIISVPELGKILEGEIRPSHFDGVTTVVYRLFELIRPTTAYFGLKDYQQFIIIKQMAKDLALPINIQGMPIIRESEGLALSSRNQYLSTEQKEVALILSKTLKEISTLIAQDRKRLPLAENKIKEILHDPGWNYLQLRDAENLDQNISKSQRIVLLGVYQLGSTRLLDNIQMELQ